MEKFRQFITALVFLMLTTISQAQATPEAKDLVGNFSLGIDSMYINTDNDRLLNGTARSSLDHGYGAGLQFSYRMSANVELRAFWHSLNIEIENKALRSPSAKILGLDALIFPDEKSLYFLLGLNHVKMQEEDVSAAVGVGYRMYFSDKFSLHTEGKTFYDLDNSHTDFALGMGLTYYFNQPKAAVTRKKRDLDGDGVPDAQDACPNSARGAFVNSAGCADNDRDGVANTQDQCPRTVVGHKVNKMGCADDDRDGVANMQDQCPRTVVGHKVNKMGCADDDHDGVDNSRDKCLNSQPGSTVDVSGCSDHDNDGVFDHLDKCPNSARGEQVDNTGCARLVDKSITIELLVHFDTNKAQVTSKYYPAISALADYMKKYPDTKVELAGHTSSEGAKTYNQLLSEKRAKAVAQLLINKYQIEATRVTAVGYGETQLKSSATNARAHAGNRRMQALITTKE